MSTTNLLEILAREIDRVVEIKAIYESLDGKAGVNVRPALAMMQLSLNDARLAMANADVIAMARAIKDLKEYENQ